MSDHNDRIIETLLAPHATEPWGSFHARREAGRRLLALLERRGHRAGVSIKTIEELQARADREGDTDTAADCSAVLTPYTPPPTRPEPRDRRAVDIPPVEIPADCCVVRSIEAEIAGDDVSTTYPAHVDADGDGRCDRCGRAIPTKED